MQSRDPDPNYWYFWPKEEDEVEEVANMSDKVDTESDTDSDTDWGSDSDKGTSGGEH